MCHIQNAFVRNPYVGFGIKLWLTCTSAQLIINFPIVSPGSMSSLFASPFWPHGLSSGINLLGLHKHERHIRWASYKTVFFILDFGVVFFILTISESGWIPQSFNSGWLLCLSINNNKRWAVLSKSNLYLSFVQWRCERQITNGL